MKITLGDLKRSDIPQAIGIGACDDRFSATANQAIQRLVMSGEKWYGLTYSYRISITEGLLTWPREIASIETIAGCGVPMPIRSEWFSFVEAGYGIRDKNAYCDSRNDLNRWDRQAFDRGMSPLFSDVVATGNPKQIKLYADIAESGAGYVWLFGTDTAGNVLRTNTGGNEWVDGIRALTPTNPAIPVVFPGTVASITGVVKPLTRGALRLTSTTRCCSRNVPSPSTRRTKRCRRTGGRSSETCAWTKQPLSKFLPSVNSLRPGTIRTYCCSEAFRQSR